MKLRFLLTVLVASVALALSGCFFVSAPPTGTIEGYVVDSGSGEPVVGAKVRAYPEGGAPGYWVGTEYFGPIATTDAQGYYRLRVPEGYYTVVVTKDGFATSKAEGVKVGSTARLDIIQKPVFNPAWSLEPPEVTLTGITEGGTYAGPISYRVDAKGPNDILYIYVALGKTPGAGWLTAPREFFSSTYTTGDETTDPATYGVSGWTTFEVVVYDQNENRTHLIRNIYIEPAAGQPIQPPQNPGILAVTLSQKVAFYGEPLLVPCGAGELELQAAPPGANLYIEVAWDASPNDDTITGYRIYRKLAGEADYTLVGTIAPEGDPHASYLWRDKSADLKVGVEASYQVRAYLGTTESEAIEASTTPLGTWAVRLITPGDGATDVGLNPVFKWQPVNAPGNDQYYLWVLWDHVLGRYRLYQDFLNQTEFTYSGIAKTPFERLQPHRTYQWYIGLAVAYDNFANPKAVSMAVNDGWIEEFLPLPATDLFTFTTGDWPQ